MGYFDSKPGSYSIVRKRTHLSYKPETRIKGLIDWENISSPESRGIHKSNRRLWTLSQKNKPSDTIKMSGLSLNEKYYPAKQFRKCLNHVMMHQVEDIYNLNDPQGYLPLRELKELDKL